MDWVLISSVLFCMHIIVTTDVAAALNSVNLQNAIFWLDKQPGESHLVGRKKSSSHLWHPRETAIPSCEPCTGSCSITFSRLPIAPGMWSSNHWLIGGLSKKRFPLATACTFLNLQKWHFATSQPSKSGPRMVDVTTKDSHKRPDCVLLSSLETWHI